MFNLIRKIAYMFHFYVQFCSLSRSQGRFSSLILQARTRPAAFRWASLPGDARPPGQRMDTVEYQHEASCGIMAANCLWTNKILILHCGQVLRDEFLQRFYLIAPVIHLPQVFFQPALVLLIALCQICQMFIICREPFDRGLRDTAIVVEAFTQML